MLKFPRKGERKTKGRKGEKKGRGKKGGKGEGIEWGGLLGKEKKVFKKKRRYLACYQEGKHFFEPCWYLTSRVSPKNYLRFIA